MSFFKRIFLRFKGGIVLKGYLYRVNGDNAGYRKEMGDFKRIKEKI